MAQLQAVYYRAVDWTEPVNDFIDRLTIKRQVALDGADERVEASPASRRRARRALRWAC